MAAPMVRVKNRTGVTQVVAPEGIVLEPGVWSGPIPGSIANRLRRMGISVDVEGGDPSPETHLWMKGEKVNIYWMSPFSIGDGYATAAENMVHALIRQGAGVRAQYLWFLVKNGLLRETIDLLSAPDYELYTVGVCMATPGEFRKLPTPYKIGWTMYESTDPLRHHPEWRHECNAVDRLFVPSEYCKEIFSRFVTKPIDVVPLAINPIYCEPVKRTPKDTFTIICFATLTGRKAPLETLEVFKRAFPRDRYPDVRMHFKTRLGLFGINENQLPKLDDPRVKISDEGGWLPHMMRDYLDSADCMLYLSRGEGFGMPPREAMARGVPTIMAANTGMLEVCNDHYNWPVPIAHTEPCPLGGDWEVADEDYAVDVLRHIYDNREEAYGKALRGAEWFVSNHGPDAAARVCIETLRQIAPFKYLEGQKGVRAEEAWLAEHRRLEELRRVHDPFHVRLEEVIPPPGPVMVLGDEATVDFIRACDYKICTDLPCAKVCCSIDYMHRLSDEEIVRMLRKQLEGAPQVLFSVPSVFRAVVAGVGERLLRKEQWRDILVDFDVADIRYYDDRQHIVCHIVGLSSGFRGSMVRHGRTIGGVWRPKHSPSA